MLLSQIRSVRPYYREEFHAFAFMQRLYLAEKLWRLCVFRKLTDLRAGDGERCTLLMILARFLCMRLRLCKWKPLLWELSGFSRVGLIKVDVEGHELEVLRGALSTIEKDRPSILVEAEDRHRPNAFASVCELLAPFGYTAWYLREGRLRRADDMSRSKDVPRNFLFLYRGNPARHSQLADLFLK